MVVDRLSKWAIRAAIPPYACERRMTIRLPARPIAAPHKNTALRKVAGVT